MRLVFIDDHNAWAVEYQGQPVAIGGTVFYTERADAEAEIAKRGLVILDGGDIVKPEQVPTQRPAPQTEQEEQDAPTEPEPSKDDEDDTTHTTAAGELQENDEMRTETPAEAREREAAEKAVQRHNKGEAAPQRGRPVSLTPEEARERRREQNRRYYHERSEARKREDLERSKNWWKDHPDRAAEYRRRANEKRRERYANDPEFRARVAEANRKYQERKNKKSEE